jgi:hypothetical protein
MTGFVGQLTIFPEPIWLARFEKSLGRQEMNTPEWYVLPTTILSGRLKHAAKIEEPERRMR